MIEIICKEESAKETWNQKEENIRLPKNIRQIGSPRGRHKIYLEDYVYTYLRTIAKDKEACAAVFMGKSQVLKDIRYTFINGVVECSSAIFQWERICLDDSFWDYIYKEEKQYFPETEIVGWFLGKAGQAMELAPAVEAAHRKYFAGRDKILMLMDILEEEELFFVYEQGYLQKREGYYIYYEKNLSMQEYMVSKREEEQRREAELADKKPVKEDPELEIEDLSEELKDDIIPNEGNEISLEEQFSEFSKDYSQTDSKKHTENFRDSEADAQAMLKQMRNEEKKIERKMREGSVHSKKESQDKIFVKSNLEEPKTQAEEALEAYRRTILERQGKQAERENKNLLYTAASFFLVVLCVIGITTINNYRRMQKVEDVLNLISPKEISSKQQKPEEQGDLVVESIDSQVMPLEKKGDKPSGENKAGDVTLEPEGAEGGKTGKTSDGAEKKEEPAEESKKKPDEKSGEDTKAQETKENTKSEETKENTETEKLEDNSKAGESEGSEKPEKSEDSAKEGTTGESQPNKNENNIQETSAGGQKGEARYYTVQKGDTLNSICLAIYQNKDMLDKLREVNGIEDGDKIFAGQRLVLP